jgi:hypothetical protein
VLAEPTFVDESALPSGPDLPALRPARKPVARLDALIDALATLSLEAPMIGEMVQPHLPATRRVGSKVFMIEGLDVESGEWETPVPGGRYSEFQAGVQLANRTGALNEIEYSEFRSSGSRPSPKAPRRSPTCPTCSRRWRVRASSMRSRASTMRSSRSTCGRAPRRGASATSRSTRAGTASSTAWCRVGWSIRRPTRARRRC